MGKTDTIRQRRVDVYLPSLEAKKRWNLQAKEAGTSLSKYISRIVEDTLESEPVGPNPHELQEELVLVRGQLEKAMERVRLLEALRDKLDTELKIYRTEPFLRPDFKGTRNLDKRLVELLRGHSDNRGCCKPLKADRIWALLDIAPHDSEAIRAVNSQLELLFDYGLVDISASGYRWQG